MGNFSERWGHLTELGKLRRAVGERLSEEAKKHVERERTRGRKLTRVEAYEEVTTCR